MLYYLSIGGMTPGANVTITGLSAELQRLLRSFSAEDFQALQEHEPTCSFFVEDVGKATSSWLHDLRQQVEFIGEVTLGILKSLFHPRRMRWNALELKLAEPAAPEAVVHNSGTKAIVGVNLFRTLSHAGPTDANRPAELSGVGCDLLGGTGLTTLPPPVSAASSLPRLSAQRRQAGSSMAIRISTSGKR